MVALVLVSGDALGLVQIAHAETHDSRCTALLANQSLGDYISFEAEGWCVR